MTRFCAKCEHNLSHQSFSPTQWLKGEGVSRCKTCIGASLGLNRNLPLFSCWKCNRFFSDKYELNEHAKFHRTRSLSCAFCGGKTVKAGFKQGLCSDNLNPLEKNGQGMVYRSLFEYAFKQFQAKTNPWISDDTEQSELPHYSDKCQDCVQTLYKIMEILRSKQFATVCEAKHGIFFG